MTNQQIKETQSKIKSLQSVLSKHDKQRDAKNTLLLSADEYGDIETIIFELNETLESGDKLIKDGFCKTCGNQLEDYEFPQQYDECLRCTEGDDFDDEE